MKHKKLSFVLLLLLAMVLTACGGTKTEPTTSDTSSSSTTSDTTTDTTTDKPADELKPADIIITNGKGEIAKQFEQATKDFMTKYPQVKIEFASNQVGDSLGAFDKMTSAGKIVTLSMQEPGTLLGAQNGTGVDLSKEKWAAETTSIVKDKDGTPVGFPFATEGFGIVYNKEVVEKAVGGAFDPFSINTRTKLKEFLDKVKASGVKYPVAYQTEPWSVGNHFGTIFVNQSEDPGKIVADVASGALKLKDNAAWNGMLDTMDLLASPDYNKYGKAVLGKYYDEAHLLVGTGEAAILANGNWAFDSFKAPRKEFGFMPFPVDDNADNPMNNRITVGPTQVMIINKKATPEQQAAAKKFLEWIVYDTEGQEFLVTKSQIVPAFKNITLEVNNPLGKAIQKAIVAGKIQPFSTNYVNGKDYFEKVGPEVQKYLDKKVTREQLAKFYEDIHAANK